MVLDFFGGGGLEVQLSSDLIVPPGSDSLSFSPFLSSVTFFCQPLLWWFPVSSSLCSQDAAIYSQLCSSLQDKRLPLSWSLPPQTSTVACRSASDWTSSLPLNPLRAGEAQEGRVLGVEGKRTLVSQSRGPQMFFDCPLLACFHPSCLCHELDPRATEKTQTVSFLGTAKFSGI